MRPPRLSEPTPQWVLPVPPGPDDPLGESVYDQASTWCRVFEPAEVCLVLGRYQDAARELRLAAARADGVPVYRRSTGGGAVVLAPGCLVLALRLRHREPGADAVFARINRPVGRAIGDCTGRNPVSRGHGDLAMPVDEGPERKILGASLRQSRLWDHYLGVLLVADLRPLMERYLASPSRMPDYRAARDHDAFCTCLSAWGVDMRDLRSRIGAYLASELGED